MVKCKSLLKVFTPTRFPTAIEGSDVLIEYCSYSLVTLCNLNLKEEKQTKTLIETKTALNNWLEKCKERKWWWLFITSTVPFLVPCLTLDSSVWSDSHLCDVSNIYVTELVTEWYSEDVKIPKNFLVIWFVSPLRWKAGRDVDKAIF